MLAGPTLGGRVMARHDELMTQAFAHAKAERYDEALALCQRVLRDAPGHLSALTTAVSCYHAKGDLVRATHFARQARLAHDRLETRMGLAFLLAKGGDRESALEELGPLLDGPRASSLACYRAAGLLCDLGRADEAATRSHAWANRWPTIPNLWQAHVDALARLGDVRAQLAALREGIGRFRGYRLFPEWLASTLLYADNVPEDEVIRAAHAQAGLLRDVPPVVASNPPRDGVLRVGLVSPDLRAHAVAFFIRPFLEYHDRASTRVFVYDTGDEADATTATLRPQAHAWRSCHRLTDAQVAQAVRDDGVHVLIDLVGLTRGSRPGILAARPAPVQATYLGYAGMTCLPGYDYRVVDSRTDPPGSDTPGAEKLVRLDPCFLCYRPADDLPPLMPPAGAGAPVTFGSFNALLKVTPTTVALWSRVLSHVPGSRMIVKAWGLETPAAKARLRGMFAAQGIVADRLDLLALAPSPREHLATYHRVDIALDTFPYHGTTTTCEALSMGVPVVSRVGEVHRARVGLSILSAVGLADLAATTDEAFVETAVGLANDPARRAAWRSAGPEGLRARLAASPLGDGPGFARRLEALLRTLIEKA
ncbi:MAG: hypothetical protein HBSAPP03_06220 [Phycisphaerae bacterium]|nr:MAG: hypothetical protein HBSAPP03_06220 [Phycisphaerae bacterium]